MAAPFVFGFISLAIGQDANYDLANYHWYNPYAFLHGRGDFDVAPAQVPTFFNPLLDVPLFLFAQHAPPMLCSFILGALHGLNFIVLYALARALLPEWSAWARGGGGALIATLGVTGGGVFGLLGTTFYDNVLSLFFLTALWHVCSALRRDALSARTFLTAGLLAGCAVGLKLPTATYAFGLAVACAVLPGSISLRVARVATFGLAGLAGVILLGGFWMLHLWRHFGNPIFPHFNNVIGSAMALNEEYRDVTFIPHSLLEALFFPIEFTLNPYYVGEVDFTDLRILLLWVAALATLVACGLAPRARKRFSVIAPPVRFVLTMALASYLAWLSVFAIYRYLVAAGDDRTAPDGRADCSVAHIEARARHGRVRVRPGPRVVYEAVVLESRSVRRALPRSESARFPRRFCADGAAGRRRAARVDHPVLSGVRTFCADPR